LIHFTLYNLPSLHDRSATNKQALVDEVRQWKLELERKPYATTIEVHMQWVNRRNIDNLCKTILDAIQAATGIDDSWFDFELHLYKIKHDGAAFANVMMAPISPPSA
jgi:Holliday junction resolvase RusA-like endonuclease